MQNIENAKEQGAKRSSRNLGGIRIPYAAERPVTREDTNETVETRYGASGASIRGCFE